MATSRVLCAQPKPDAELRLICFPSAGSGASMFRTWGSFLPQFIEVIGLHLPGRESLMAEPLQDSIEALVAEVRPTVETYLDRPFALFGHSMGAWIAFELLRTLRREGKSMPVHFFASGRRAPQIDDPRSAIHQLPNDDLVQRVLGLFGGIPDAILAEPELLELLLPVLRADLKAVETYEYTPEPQLCCPITAFGGEQDGQVSLADLEGWREQTSRAFNLQRFPGAHFYLNGGSCEALCRTLDISLRNSLAGSAPDS